MKKILLIGNGAREHIIAKTILNSRHEVQLFVFASAINPGLEALAFHYQVGDINNNAEIIKYAKAKDIDWAVIGPEGPLAQGVVDDLKQANIPSFGPVKELAKLETSKSFTRDLMREYNIPGIPAYRTFHDVNQIKEWLGDLGKDFVIKPDGLTGGKGVKVQGDHFTTRQEGLEIISDLINEDGSALVEAKLIGQEFSLMSICDGKNLFHLPAVQDHKRVFTDDQGPNTGGMGSYSCADLSLPFLHTDDIKVAQEINQATAKALNDKFKNPYKGVLYGGFIATADGVKLIEYNARFGDPEAMNVLSVLKSDFIDICQAVIDGNLNTIKSEFYELATVCKYLVPAGYPDNPVRNVEIDVSRVDENKVDIFYAAVDQRENGLYMTGSRAVALIAKHENLYEAEKIVEEEVKKIKGQVFHRQDIGTKELIDKRVKMMGRLME